MWEPRPLANLGACTDCNRDIFTFFTFIYDICKLQYVRKMPTLLIIRDDKRDGDGIGGEGVMMMLIR
jgi:hypothetical protein